MNAYTIRRKKAWASPEQLQAVAQRSTELRQHGFRARVSRGSEVEHELRLEA